MIDILLKKNYIYTIKKKDSLKFSFLKTKNEIIIFIKLFISQVL